MLFKLLRGGGFNKYKVTHFSAHKYMKSVTETALLYRPQQMLNLTTEENIKDRVVQTFFDSSNFHIKVSEAEHRLTDINSGSTPAHSFYQINRLLPSRRIPSQQNPRRIPHAVGSN